MPKLVDGIHSDPTGATCFRAECRDLVLVEYGPEMVGAYLVSRLVRFSENEFKTSDNPLADRLRARKDFGRVFWESEEKPDDLA